MEKKFSFQLPLTFSTGTKKMKRKHLLLVFLLEKLLQAEPPLVPRSLCVICNVGLVWKEGILRKKMWRGKISWGKLLKINIYLYPSTLQCLISSFSSSMLYFPFSTAERKKKSSINLLLRHKKRKKKMRKIVFFFYHAQR